MTQGTDEWLAARIGVVTASQVKALWTSRYKPDAAGVFTLARNVATERLTGLPVSQFSGTRATLWGHENEAAARLAYEERSGYKVQQAGLLLHMELDGVGCSPDGLVGDDGCVEIKCPDSATLVGWIAAGVIPLDYESQMLHQLEVTGRVWVDFCAYDPRLPRSLWVWRYEPTEEVRATYRKRLEDLLKLIEEIQQKCQ